MERVLAHAFISGGKAGGRMVGEEAEYDIFLSYRVATDAETVETVYNALTKLGQRVFW